MTLMINYQNRKRLRAETQISQQGSGVSPESLMESKINNTTKNAHSQNKEADEIFVTFTVDFNSLWPRGFGNILGTWESSCELLNENYEFDFEVRFQI